MRCPDCGGLGLISSRYIGDTYSVYDCPTCHGTGEVPDKKEDGKDGKTL